MQNWASFQVISNVWGLGSGKDSVREIGHVAPKIHMDTSTCDRVLVQSLREKLSLSSTRYCSGIAGCLLYFLELQSPWGILRFSS